jgi:hypothetical protein
MAKKASSNATTTRIWLSEARELVVEAKGSGHLAERLLVEWLGEGKVRWSCKLFEGPSASDLPARQREAARGAVRWIAPNVAYSDGDPAFWRIPPKIDWEENSAHEPYVVGGARAEGIEVALEDVLALLPEEPGRPGKATTTKKWVTDQFRRMKQAGEIPPAIRKLANELAKRMKKDPAVKKPVGARHIENMLRIWRLWPIS